MDGVKDLEFAGQVVQAFIASSSPSGGVKFATQVA